MDLLRAVAFLLLSHSPSTGSGKKEAIKMTEVLHLVSFY